MQPAPEGRLVTTALGAVAIASTGRAATTRPGPATVAAGLGTMATGVTSVSWPLLMRWWGNAAASVAWLSVVILLSLFFCGIIKDFLAWICIYVVWYTSLSKLRSIYKYKRSWILLCAWICEPSVSGHTTERFCHIIFFSVPPFFSFLHLAWINRMEVSVIPEYFALYAFFKKGSTVFENVCLIVYVCFVLCLCRDWFCGVVSRKGLRIYMRSFEECICLCVRNFECPEATLLSWQDVKIELQTPIQDHCAAFFQPVTTTTLGMAAPRCAAIARTTAHATRRPATASTAALMATAGTTAALVSFLYQSWSLLAMSGW